MSQIILGLATLFIAPTIAADKYETKLERVIDGAEATQIMKSLYPEVTTGNLFDGSTGDAVTGCKVLLTVAAGDDNYSEVLVVNAKTYKPSEARFWMAKGVEYVYVWEDYGYQKPGDEKGFYVRHTFKAKNTNRYTIVVDQAGDAGIDLSMTLSKADKKIKILCQSDF